MNKLQAISNDAIGRRTEIARSGTKMTETRSDAYGYNDRSELTNAVKNATLNEYAYQYDDIGNRETAFERGTNSVYTANCLNQYTDIEYSAVQPSTSNLQPLYDADGNQTLVTTKTGIWSVTYNGENRPIRWELVTSNSNTSNSNTQTILEMKFDRMGRRVEYIESVASSNSSFIIQHSKFVYDGYLCIQRLNGTNNSITELFEWDPTEKVATRPMFMQYRVPGQTYALFYTHDGNKNVSEVVHFSRANGVAAHYEYAPFGEVTAQVRQGGVTAYDFAALNPWRFSSEYADDASATVYYNYRHYEPVMGRWLQRDMIGEAGSHNLYAFVRNSSMYVLDILGTRCIVYVFIGHYPGRGSEQEYHPDSILSIATDTIGNCDTSCDGILSLSCHMKSFLDAATNVFPRIKVPSNWPPGPYDDDRVTNIADFDVLLSSGKFDNAIDSLAREISSDCCCEKITVRIKCDKQAVEGFAALSRPGVGSLLPDQNPCVNGGKEYVIQKPK